LEEAREASIGAVDERGLIGFEQILPY